MKVIWNKFSRMGIGPNMSKRVSLRIQIINEVCLICLMAIFSIIGSYLIYGYWQSALWIGCSIPFLMLPFWMHRSPAKRKFSTSIFLSLFSIFIAIGALAMGEASGIQYGAAILPMMVIIFFDNQFFTNIAVAIAAVLFFGCELLFAFQEPFLQHSFPLFLKIITGGMIAAIVYQLVAYFRRNANEREKIVRKNNNNLKKQAEKIEYQNLQLRETYLILEGKNKQLKKEAKERQKMQSRLKKANDELQQFASVASHDLKEPLRTISSFSSLLVRNIKGNNEKNDEYLNFITDAAKRMSRMLEDLADYARSGRNNQEPTAVNLNHILLDVQQNLRSKIEETQAELIFDPLPVVMGERTHFHQLFQNIIANALKFQQEDTKPFVNIKVEKSEQTCLISIEDNGIGISDEYLDQIFNPFTRLHTRLEFEGSGIGLATCRKIVENYHGKIWASSELNKGTAFFIQLPVLSWVETPVDLSRPSFSKSNINTNLS